MTIKEGATTVGEFFANLWNAVLSTNILHVGMAIGGIITFLVAYVISSAGDEHEEVLIRIAAQVVAIAVAVIGAGLVVTGVLGIFRFDVLDT